LLTCRGPNSRGEPTGRTETFSPTDEQIYACGKLQTNYDEIALAVNWLYEDQPIFHDELIVTNGYFYSRLPIKPDALSEGTYEIHIVVGREIIQELEFQVKQPKGL
jgi:hypothetical protein